MKKGINIMANDHSDADSNKSITINHVCGECCWFIHESKASSLKLCRVQPKNLTGRVKFFNLVKARSLERSVDAYIMRGDDYLKTKSRTNFIR